MFIAGVVLLSHYRLHKVQDVRIALGSALKGEGMLIKVAHRVMCEVGVAIITVVASHEGIGAKPPLRWLKPLLIGSHTRKDLRYCPPGSSRDRNR